MTTNQAFIRAYRHDAAEERHKQGPIGPQATARAGSPQRVSAAAAPEQALSFAYADVLGTNVAYVSPNEAYPPINEARRAVSKYANTLAPAEAGLYGPELDIELLQEPVVAPATSSIRPPAMRSSIGKRPLSAFTNRSATTARPTTSVAAGTTISALRWPATCRQLMQHHAQRFDRALDMLLAEANQGRTLVGVLGLFRSVGATTTALCLAARLAASHQRVVIIDGHFQAPRLHECLDAEPIAWWQDVLERRADLSDALVRAETDNLDVLALNPTSRRAPATLQLAASAGALRHAYDVALFDLGTFFDPISQPLALDLARQMRIDTAIAVTAADRHDPRDLESVAERLSDCGCELLGTIENRAV